MVSIIGLMEPADNPAMAMTARTRGNGICAAIQRPQHIHGGRVQQIGEHHHNDNGPDQGSVHDEGCSGKEIA